MTTGSLSEMNGEVLCNDNDKLIPGVALKVEELSTDEKCDTLVDLAANEDWKSNCELLITSLIPKLLSSSYEVIQGVFDNADCTLGTKVDSVC